MRITRAVIIVIAIGFLALAAAAASSASAAEPAAQMTTGKSLAPPVVARLSDEGDSNSSSRRSFTRTGIGASTCGQLAGTLAVIVFAFFISGLTRGARRSDLANSGSGHPR